MATHLLCGVVPCRLLVPDSGPPAVRKLMYKSRKTQKPADVDTILLSCRLFTWQLGSLLAGLAGKTWGHGTNGRGPLVQSPSECNEQRPWGWVYLGPCLQSWCETGLFLSWSAGESYSFPAWKGARRAGSCRSLSTDEVRSKYQMHAENSVQSGHKFIVITDFRCSEHATTLFFLKAGFCSVMPTTA